MPSPAGTGKPRAHGSGAVGRGSALDRVIGLTPVEVVSADISASRKRGWRAEPVPATKTPTQPECLDEAMELYLKSVAEAA
jgi:hypothetical protein